MNGGSKLIEIWKDVVGYEQYYQVSNLGRIRSKDREVRNNKGKCIKAARILKPQQNNNGYLYFQIKLSGRMVKLYIHRMVASAFIPNTNNKPQVNHIDNNPQNNCVNNLEWVTPKENVHHAMKQGRFDKSFSMTLEKFAESRMLKQRPVIGINVKTGEIVEFETVNEAGRHFNNRAGDICKCCQGERQTAQGYKWKYK